jgi:23S rRNA pseudouridine1911/1915/1917 synthase
MTPEPLALLDVLQQQFPDSSKTTLRKLLQNDRVHVNGAAERDAKRAIERTDRVEVAARAARQSLDRRLTILYEDTDLIVVDKPTGLLTVASPDERTETAEAFLDAYLGARAGQTRAHVVHRLDRDSSGVLVFAKDADMRDRLKDLFATHDIDRIYVAIVHGRLAEPAGTFHSFLAEDRALQVRSVADTGQGKEAITHYRTVTAGDRYSLLEVTLETGRRNQIRVHLSEAGHPIVGDAMYGKGREDPLGRLALHARLLAFVHPGKGNKMTFHSLVPEAFTKLKL